MRNLYPIEYTISSAIPPHLCYVRLPSNHMKPCGFSIIGNHLKLVCMARVLCVQFVPARTSRFVVASGLARLALAWVIVKLQETFNPHTLSHTGGAARRVPGSLGWPKGLCGRQELVAGCCRHVLPWCSAAGGQYSENLWELRRSAAQMRANCERSRIISMRAASGSSVVSLAFA